MTTKYISSNASHNENQLTLPTIEVVENKGTNTNEPNLVSEHSQKIAVNSKQLELELPQKDNSAGKAGNTGWGTPTSLDVDQLPKPKELRKEMLPKSIPTIHYRKVIQCR